MLNTVTESQSLRDNTPVPSITDDVVRNWTECVQINTEIHPVTSEMKKLMFTCKLRSSYSSCTALKCDYLLLLREKVSVFFKMQKKLDSQMEKKKKASVKCSNQSQTVVNFSAITLEDL